MIIIGEKINGTIPAVGAAIATKDRDFITDLALRQSESGADYIDICASTTPEQEVEALKWLIDAVQAVTNTPISIDSPDPLVIREVFGYIKRPGLINSVSLEGEKTTVLFPMIADTEWQCVVMLCDDSGIPSEVESRLRIAKKMVDLATTHGITPDRLHVDPLVMALPTDGASMAKFMSCCREIKALYPDIHITSGLSNISYGLPARKSLNQSFLILAMSAGMDSAIMNPLDRDMVAAVLSTEALLGKDRHCRNFTNAYREGRIGRPKE